MEVLSQLGTAYDVFVENVCLIIESRLDDSTFGVEQLSEAVLMSRANLHRRLKATIGYSPGCLIQRYRIQKAMKYLKLGYSSSQTAYRTGFESPAYFTKCFRKFIGVTPIQFKAKQQSAVAIMQ